MGGLPITVKSTGISPGATIAGADTFAGEVPSAGRIISGATSIALAYRATADADTEDTQIGDLGTGTNANRLRISGVYVTDEP